jgi:glycosyltransferase involved in cell wall biosynthesis
VFCPAFHHLLDAPREPGPVLVEGAPYHFVRTRPYRRNGVGRLANMGELTLAIARNADAFVSGHGRPDVVIASSPHPYIFLATHRIARRFGAVSIFEVRDLWPLSLVELAGVNRFHPLVTATGWLERYAYRNADHVVSLHPGTRSYMAQRGLGGQRWHYIPNGIDSTEAPVLLPGEPAYRQLRAWQEKGHCVVLYAGALGPPNNIDVLIRAAARLRDEGDDRLRFLIVGRGELQDELAGMISAQGLADRVALHSQVPKSHALALMAAADIGYISLKPMPIFQYGISPNKLYDYMLARLPVVSAIAASNDPVTDAGCGVTVTPGDVGAICDAFSRLAALDRTSLKEMGARGEAYVRADHDYAHLSRRYAQLFRTGPNR